MKSVSTFAKVTMAATVALSLMPHAIHAQRGSGGEGEEQCGRLEAQWREAAPQHSGSPKFADAQQKANDGMSRCQSGSYELGIGLLQEALEAIGVEPQYE